MSRKNIFEINAGGYNLAEEVAKIERLISHEQNFCVEGRTMRDQYLSAENYLNNGLFREWKYRETTLDTSEYRKRKGIEVEELKLSIAIDENPLISFLVYCEYVLNMMLLIDRVNEQTGYIGRHNTSQLKTIIENVVRIISSYNFKNFFDGEGDDRKIIIVEENPAATAVAELIEDNEISRDIIRYNHFMLKGDVYEKKKKLTQFYKEYEKIEKDLKASNFSALESNLGFSFNALGIRHDKSDNKITNELVKEMNPSEIEEWCDRVYDTFLFAKLAINNINNKKHFDWLRTGVVKK